jgi:hypothetical protein
MTPTTGAKHLRSNKNEVKHQTKTKRFEGGSSNQKIIFG